MMNNGKSLIHSCGLLAFVHCYQKVTFAALLKSEHCSMFIQLLKCATQLKFNSSTTAKYILRLRSGQLRFDNYELLTINYKLKIWQTFLKSW